MAECDHPQLESGVTCYRLTDGDQGDPHAFVADLRVRCAECGEPFGFKGLPMGVMASMPTLSADALELRAPLVSPAERQLPKGEGVVCVTFGRLPLAAVLASVRAVIEDAPPGAAVPLREAEQLLDGGLKTLGPAR